MYINNVIPFWFKFEKVLPVYSMVYVKYKYMRKFDDRGRLKICKNFGKVKKFWNKSKFVQSFWHNIDSINIRESDENSYNYWSQFTGDDKKKKKKNTTQTIE